MTSKVTYQGGLRTEAVHLKSGNTIITDAPVDNHGNGEAFSPTDLTVTSLGSCILTIMGIVASKRDIDIKGATADIKKVMASDPRRIARIEINIEMPANDYSDSEKKIMEKAAYHCPVGLSLNENTEEVVSITWL